MALLSLKGVNASYGNVKVLHDINIEVDEGQTVCLLGANGAGKSTTIKAIMGMVASPANSISFDGEVISGMNPNKIVKKRVALVPEGRHIFSQLTVTENLKMGAYVRSDKKEIEEDLNHVFDRFPRLNERQNQMGGTLSGGEQQMLAIGRAMMVRPKLLLMDEPSMGLSPLMREEIFETIMNINKDGTTVFLVEQNAALALAISKHGYVLENGHIVYQGTKEELLCNDVVAQAYLGKKQCIEKK
ncbi:MAG TPA: ABC transporter ATP-binding protein [Anaerovoracaceae bacterium]|nr:ABC transporter ATP-binding protein [Anaerovoracaceae bacterium]